DGKAVSRTGTPAGAPRRGLPARRRGYLATCRRTGRRTEEGFIMVLYGRVWSPAQLLVLAGGILFIVLGPIAVIDGGRRSPLPEPVVQVFGLDHTPLLGLVELGAGALLILSAVVGSRGTSVVLSVLLVIGGILVLARLDWSETHLTDQRAYGWVPVLVGGVCLLALMLVPEVHARRTVLH